MRATPPPPLPFPYPYILIPSLNQQQKQPLFFCLSRLGYCWWYCTTYILHTKAASVKGFRITGFHTKAIIIGQ